MTAAFAKYPAATLIAGGQTLRVMNVREQGMALLLDIQAVAARERPAAKSGGRSARRLCRETHCPRCVCPGFVGRCIR